MPRSKRDHSKPYATTFDIARVLGVSPPTVVNWINQGRLRAHQTAGKHRRVAREDLVSFGILHKYPITQDALDELYGKASEKATDKKVIVVVREIVENEAFLNHFKNLAPEVRVEILRGISSYYCMWCGREYSGQCRYCIRWLPLAPKNSNKDSSTSQEQS